MNEPSITCPTCDLTSFNENDVREKYCGRCHAFHADMHIPKMVLYAWVGEDELGSGEYGLKQGLVPAGMIPLVACKEGKVDQQYIVDMMKAQAMMYGKTISLVRFTFDGVVMELKP